MDKRERFTGLNSIKFTVRFHKDEACYKYLSDIKWENGYACKKCQNMVYCIGVKPHSRRCIKCGYDESPTSGTMFDKCKVPIHIAFHIVFRLSTKKKGMSSLELSSEFEQRQKTCWEFKWKVQQAMSSSLKYPLTGEIHIDECYIGGEEIQKRGRSKGKKKLVIVALEKLPFNGVGRAYAQIIEDASSNSFRPFFEDHISKDAVISTDGWTGYSPLKKEYPNLKQISSNSGKNHPDMHIHIMNMKGWLRGIHHHCSSERMQGYLDEYGGIEWCVLHHHRASTFLPLDYTTTENLDGSKTIWVAEYEPRHGMRWTIGVTIFPGKSYFKTEGRIHNSSPLTHTFLFWANVATHTNNSYQAIFPPSAQNVTFHSKTDFTTWPIGNSTYRGSDLKDIDISWWKNMVSSNSFFIHELQEDFMGGYDHGKQAGTVHIGDHNIVRGAKLWEWGSGKSGQATEAMLTENSGPYVELMVGAYSDNQPDYSWIRPYEVKKWEQYWYPVRGIQGFKYANLEGAVNLEPKNEKKRFNVFLGYYATSKVNNAKVVLKNKDKTVFEKNITISPDKPFAETIRMDGNYNLIDLHTQLINTATGDVLIEYQPVEYPAIEENPADWQGYPEPAKLETVEELYLTGQRVEQFYAPRYNPMDWYNAALEKDPGDIKTNIAVGNINLKNGNYIAARKFFAKAIQRLTNDYTRPSSCEALYLQGLTLRRLGLVAEAEDTLYRGTWDYAYHSAAYFQLAELSCAKNDFQKALRQINESLSTNVRNNSAVTLKASIQRRMHDFREATATLDQIVKVDPLDFRIKNEYYLIAKESGDIQKASNLLESLNKEMRDFDDNYLSLAIGYLNNGLLKEAKEVFERFKGNNPFFNYYLGYISDKNGDAAQALSYFKTAARQSIDYVFPYRLESIDVLNTALKYNPTDGQAYYFIGNILFEKQPDIAMQNWEKATLYNPDLSIAYRNLGWGYFYYNNDIPAAISQYEKAIDLNKSEAIYYSELSELYERNNTPIVIRSKLFEESDETIIKKRDDSYMWLIETLVLSDKPDKAVELLENVTLAYREGTSRARNVRINANLMLGKQYFDKKEYQKALDYFSKAQITREEAGNDRQGDRGLQVDYYIGLANEALHNRSQATAAFKKSVQESSQAVNVMNYYQGLSYAKLGNNDQARKIFNTLVSEANSQLEQSTIAEVGVIFGEREAANDRQSRLYTMRGLGYKGLGNIQKAKTDLDKALELSQSNLWAKVERIQ